MSWRASGGTIDKGRSGVITDIETRESMIFFI